MKKLLTAALMLAMIPCAAEAKQWTITQRQEAQRKTIDRAQRANELTKKEADKLRGQLDDIAADEIKMKAKNGGQLSYKDKAKLEKGLNGVSLRIQKYSLKKRVIKPQ